MSFDTVLIVGSPREGALELSYSRAFRRLGVGTVEHFDTENSSSSLKQNRIVNRLTQRMQYKMIGGKLFGHLQTNKYDAIIVFKGMLLTPAWLKRCRTISSAATWINLNPDDPFNITSRGATNGNVSSSIGCYDIYVTWGKHLTPLIQQQGCATAFFLPFAHDADNHYPADAALQGNGDYVAFVGTWDREREEILSELSDLPIKIYGHGWNRIATRSPLCDKVRAHNVYGEELRQIISSAKASINILRPQNHGSHNMRTFEIPAMRGLMVTTYSEEQNSFFPDGAASLMFSNTTELRQKLKLILDGGYNVAQMKEAAFRLSRDQSYDSRARMLRDKIVEYQQSKTAP
jgi:spore maturation protein CgeB